MIYLTITEQRQIVCIPRHGWTPSGAPALKAVSTVDNAAIALTVNRYEVAGAFIRLWVTLPDDIYTGEWRYELTFPAADGQTAQSTGLLKVTESAEAAEQYNRETTYIQYGNQ